MKTHIIIVAMRDTGEELERAEVRAEEAIVAAAAAEMVANYAVTPGSHVLIAVEQEDLSFTEMIPLNDWLSDYKKKITSQRVRW